MSIFKNMIQATAGIALMATVAAAPQIAEAKTVIRVQSVISATADEVTMLNDFGQDVSDLTNGEVVFEILPAGAVVGSRKPLMRLTRASSRVVLHGPITGQASTRLPCCSAHRLPVPASASTTSRFCLVPVCGRQRAV